MIRIALLGLWMLWAALPAQMEWSRFRGPNGTGVAAAKGLPLKFGPAENVEWKTPLPPGHSSPILGPDRIFLTALEDEKLFVFAIDKQTGRIQWRREVPRPRRQELHKSNQPASPSPVTDGKNVYAFFTDFGLISYGPDGNERWRMPLGPFNNPFGMGASPILSGNTLLQSCDSESGSFFIAVDKDTGKVKWRADRPDFSRGFSTPVLYQPEDGGAQVLIPGSYQLTAYEVKTGKPVWWVRGLTWQLKPTPAMGDGVLYVLGWAGGSDTGEQEDVPPFEQMLSADANQDKQISREELAQPKFQKAFGEIDLDRDGLVGERDWRLFRSRRSAQNAVLAIKLGGRGDMTESNILWRYTRSLPNVPSPLLYQNVLYLMKEGGILTALDAGTGTVLKQARLDGALDQYFASPVAADGRVYAVSQAGHVSVIRPGKDWELLQLNDMDDECYATPAFENDRIYLRTRGALYCFREKGATSTGSGL